MDGAPQRSGRYWTWLSVAHVTAALLVTVSVLFDLFGPYGRYWHHPTTCHATTPALRLATFPEEYTEDEEQYLLNLHPANPATHRVKFDSKIEWEAWDSTTTTTWRSMLPPYPLGQDENFNDGIPYGLGMFHQVHCLLSIREGYKSLLYMNGTTDADREAAQNLAHIGHCFNWIRQALLCHADPHREAMLESSAHGKTEKYARTCGDWNELYDEVGYKG